MVKQYVHAWLNILVLLQTVDLSALLTQNVHLIEHVINLNVLILAQELVELVLDVRLLIITPYAVALKA